jgi:hypothetical protein
MALSYFDDKSKPPRDTDLAEVLGRTARLWDMLYDHVAENCDAFSAEWNFADKNYGWSMRLKQKKRAILYLTPRERHFQVGTVLGSKAVKAARAGKLPASAIEYIDGAQKYPEGRGMRIEVRN